MLRVSGLDEGVNEQCYHEVRTAEIWRYLLNANRGRYQAGRRLHLCEFLHCQLGI